MSTRKRKLNDEMTPASLPPSADSQPESTNLRHSPEPFSSTMAPPQSSTSSDDEAEVRKPVQKKSRTVSVGRQSKGSSHASRSEGIDPSNTSNHSSQKDPRSSKRRLDPISTATLQDLLPRRRVRRRPRGGSDIVNNSDDGITHRHSSVLSRDTNDDELSFVNETRPALRERRNTKASSRQTPVTPFPRHSAAKRSKSTRGPPKASITSSKSRASSLGKSRRAMTETPIQRTYGSARRSRHDSSDKENERAEFDVEGGNDSLDPVASDEDVEHSANDQSYSANSGEKGSGKPNTRRLETSGEKDLRRAAAKFQEIDKWELEFEEVSNVSSGRSSQIDAR
ncbi:MAG: hypothetical protein M4579_000570 [Chaenotheca gracillima]|nr:MAG: hypothetical protein M4579_000570 [Chaenotheca gracillima]